jgi:type II secretory pathway component GspD/PulD (secretin)
MNTKCTKLMAIAGAIALFPALLFPTMTRAEGGRVTINVHDANLSDVVNLIAMQSGLNIVVDASLASAPHPITLSLHNVSVEQALRSIESSNGLEHAYDNGVLHIGLAQDIFAHYPSTSRMTAGRISLSNADAVDLANRLTPFVPVGTTVFGDPRTNSLYVKGSPEGVAEVRSLVTQVDVPRVNGLTFNADYYKLNNMKATDALAVLRTELPPGGSNTYGASDHPDVVLLNGSSDFINTAKAMLHAIDQPGKMVRFSIKVLDYTPQNDSTNIGVEFGGNDVTGTAAAATGNTVYTFANKTIPINATLNLLQTQSRATVLAEPQISSLNNEKATLNIGEQYPIVYFNAQTGQNAVQFFNAGVNIAVTPVIGDDGQITCATDTEYSQITSFVSNYPVTSDRHVVSTMRIGNDQSLVIGGLFEDVDTSTITKVPILGDIPILGIFFRNKAVSHSKDEIVFVLTPHIVEAGDYGPSEAAALTLPKGIPTPPAYAPINNSEFSSKP